MRLTEIWIYPLKSARGIRLEQAELHPMGLAWDRRWVLVDPTGRFISQRECPALARLELSLRSDAKGLVNGLSFGFASSRLDVPLPGGQEPGSDQGSSGSAGPGMKTEVVSVWRSLVQAWIYPEDINQWFSEMLERPCRLAFMPASSFRETNPEFAPGGRVSFADGYPYLLCNSATLAELNARLLAQGSPAVGIERFRPNLVVDLGVPDAEDDLKSFTLGGLPFQTVKACERCVIITTDQQTGQVGSEPLKILAGYRRRKGKVIFGQNLIAGVSQGLLRVGDPLIAIPTS